MQFRLVDVYTSIPTEAGLMVCQEGKNFVSIFNDGLSATATANVPYNISYLNTALKHVDLEAVPLLKSASLQIAVPAADIADGAFGWVQVYGECEADILGAGTAGDYLEVLSSAATGFTTEGAATITLNSCAVQVDTTTAAATATIFLFGKQVGSLSA